MSLNQVSSVGGTAFSVVPTSQNPPDSTQSESQDEMCQSHPFGFAGIGVQNPPESPDSDSQDEMCQSHPFGFAGIGFQNPLESVGLSDIFAQPEILACASLSRNGNDDVGGLSAASTNNRVVQSPPSSKKEINGMMRECAAGRQRDSTLLSVAKSEAPARITDTVRPSASTVIVLSNQELKKSYSVTTGVVMPPVQHMAKEKMPRSFTDMKSTGLFSFLNGLFLDPADRASCLDDAKKATPQEDRSIGENNGTCYANVEKGEKKDRFFLPIPDVQKKRAKRKLIAKTEPSRTRNTTLNSSDGNNDYGVTSDPDHVDEDVACEETAAK